MRYTTLVALTIAIAFAAFGYFSPTGRDIWARITGSAAQSVPVSGLVSGPMSEPEAGRKAAALSKSNIISYQRAALAAQTQGAGYGPQSPRDLRVSEGRNPRSFSPAPLHSFMNLCNIHFHKNAEHRGGEFTSFAGPGDGSGFGTGYQYSGRLSEPELRPVTRQIGKREHGYLKPGDTIEVHFVFSTANVTPGPTLAACISNQNSNPQLRVETIVAVLSNDGHGEDFRKLAEVRVERGYFQAPNIPQDLGHPISYRGSTTGPGYNEKGSPYQVSWRVRPKVVKVDIHSLDAWLQSNVFEEKGAHGVRNLVINPDLIAPIDQ